MQLRSLVKTAITVVTPPVVFHGFPLPVTRVFFLRAAAKPQRCHCGHGGGATAIIGGMTAVLAVALRGHWYGSTAITVVETLRHRRKVPSLLLRDCTAVVLRRPSGGGGATAVLVRCHGGHGGAAAVMAVPRRFHCGLAQPAVHCGSFEHAQSVRRATAKDRGFDSFPRCYGDQ